MDLETLKIIADQEQKSIQDYADLAKKKTINQLNDELNKIHEKHKPLHDERVKLSMKMMILSLEIRLRLLTLAFPDANITEIKELCELAPTDQIVGDTEKWIQRLQQSNLYPRKLLVDRTRMIIRILE